MKWLIFLFIIPARAQSIETPQNITSSPCTDRNHIFLAPGVLTAGGTSRACVSRFHPEGPARFLLTLLTDEGDTISASRDLSPGDGGCLDISVPQRPNTKAELKVNIRYPEANCVWERVLTVRVASGRVVVVHAERARYRPGDTVRFRAVALKADLTPAHSIIDEVWLEGPRGVWEGVKSAQWHRVRTRLGLAQLQHQLDDLAPPGKWTVRARLTDGSQGMASFWVGNYELPPFQLTVRHAPSVLRSSERLVWTVCVRYPWSEAVEGMLVIRIRGAGGPSEGAGGIRTAVRLKAPKACHRHAAAAKRIGLNGSSPPDVIVADFSFQEDGTRLWQNTTVVSRVVEEAVTLEFLTKHRAVISPGLPYKIKVKATRWDEKPATNERVTVCRSPAMTPQETPSNDTSSCVESITDAKGIGRVMFTADDDSKPYYIFQARLNTARASLVARCSGAAGRAALGALRADPRARSLLPLYLNLGYSTTPLTVHFVVITRGGIIYRWGATTQCSTTTDRIQLANRTTICPSTSSSRPERFSNSILEGKNSSELDSLLDRHLPKVMLPIKFSHQMCPDSHLVAYFYHNNQLVTASKLFGMEECFVNKVEIAWTSRQALPGSIASLQVSTPGPALCALAVLDTSAKWVQPPENVKNLVMTGLRKLMDGHRNLTEHDAAGECFLTSDAPDLPKSSIDLMTTWLASAGIRVLGDGSPQTHCNSGPEPLMADEDSVPRSDFSESWLWRLAAVGTNGSVVVSARAPDSVSRFEASAFCLAKNGVSVSQPAVLQVFREFFIHADNPRRMRRGDTAILPYRIFNYLYQPISVKIQTSTDKHLNCPENMETVCIAPRASVARRLEVSALQPGVGKLRLKASTLRDHQCTNDTSTKDVSDEVIIRIDVEPEGIPQQEHKSALVCATDTRGTRSNPPLVWKWSKTKIVPGTESVTVWAAGNTIAPLLADPDALVQLPRGCGEQNMARLATNLLALTFLEQTSTPAAIAKDHVARGFTRQLQYVHPSGGFSAFGASDPSSSTWLTAFCVRYLRRAYRVLSGDAPLPPALLRAEQWLMAQQMENGCFRNNGHVFHHELKGGLTEDSEISSVALTAYVITSLIETSPLPSRLVKNTLSCLRAIPPSKSKFNPLRIYPHSIITYALMRLRRYEEELWKTNEAYLKDGRNMVDAGLEEDEELRELLELLKMAKRSEDYVWWETGNLATSIEATGYALLALAECPPPLKENCAGDVAGATRWLSVHRNAAGGFVSTQDTLVALEGLSRWTSVLPPANLTVSISSGLDVRELLLNPGSRLPGVSKVQPHAQLGVSVRGSGCALIQATRQYNSLSADTDAAVGRRSPLSVQAGVRTDGAFNCDNTLCFCAATVEVCVSWMGQFPEMALLEVALPGGFGADAAPLYKHLQSNDTLLRRIELSPNSGKATLYLGTRDGSDTTPRAGHQCYTVQAVGPRAKTKPAFVKVMDYYRPHIKDTQMYTIPEDCPSQITQDTNNYHASDNLFNKARSLTDSDEILISHEFSFEDIPEGIPFDEPLYDNLIKKNDTDGKVTKENQDMKNINKVNKNNNTKDATRQNKSLQDTNEIQKPNHTVTIITTAIPETNKIDNTDKKNNYVLNNNFTKLLENPHENSIIDFKDESKDVKKDVISVSDIEMQSNNKNEVKGEMKIHNTEEKLAIDNPLLTNFHVIESEKDLDVPTGVEGPIPAFVLPPKNFVPPPNIAPPINTQSTWRRFPANPYNSQYYQASVPYTPQYYQPSVPSHPQYYQPSIPYSPQYYQPLYHKQNFYPNYKTVLPPIK